MAHRDWKGTYATLTYLRPFVSLYAEAIATGDAVGYLRLHKSAENEEDAYKVLYPAYGTYVAGPFGKYPLVQWTGRYYYPIYLGSAAVGHIVGRIKAATVDEYPPPRE